MSFGADCLIQKINDRIAALEGCTYNAAQVSGSLNAIETYHCVPDLASLPAAACNEGRFIYVEDIKSFRYSDGYYWTKDACSVLGNVNTYSSLWTWGINPKGELGAGTAVSLSRCSPGTIVGGGSWCQVANGSNATLAIKTDGTLWTWGCNAQGQLGDGTTVSRCSPGTTWGSYTTWRQVSSSRYHASAIKTDGTLWTWGRNNEAQLGNGTVTERCSPGTVAGGGNTWCLVSSGYTNTAAIKTDGTLWTWGNNSSGRLGDGTTVSRCSPGTTWGSYTTWSKVSVKCRTPSAIKCDGTLWTWGENACGQLGDGTTVSRNSPGTVAGGGTTWCLSSSGYRNTAAIKTDGTLWTWGNSNLGQLGDGTATSRCSPGTVAGGGTTWCGVSFLYGSGLAIKTDGTLWTWGRADGGQLGNGTTSFRTSPGTIAGAGNFWCGITEGGSFHMSAIKSRGF